MTKILLAIFCFITSAFSFDLKPIKINDNSYYFYGKEEYFSKKNGGDISNCAFIITKNAVILIDTGSSVEYAKEVKKEISKITKKPIKYVINSHQHPDHFLGNYTFQNSDIFASKYVQEEIKRNGELYLNNMIRLIMGISGSTKVKVPNKILKEGILSLDNYDLEIFLLEGHTKKDTVVFDKNTKTLYTSDLIFNNRALATPHANIEKWIETLKYLKTLNFNTLVPGHGKTVQGKKVINENIEYLEFLHNTLKDGIENGLEPFEILSKEVPEHIKNYSIFEEEYERSIINLYEKYESKY